MDFLEHLAVHQSAGQIGVLHFILAFVTLIFLPFVGYLFGALSLSLWYGRRGRRRGDQQATMFAREVMEHVLPAKSILFLFGVVPYLAILFAYAQLLQGTPSISISILTWGALCFGLAAAFAASYNGALKLRSVLENVGKDSGDIAAYASETQETQRTSGKYALLFLSIAMLLYYCGVALASNPTEWENISSVVEMIFSAGLAVRAVEFLLISLAMASLGTIFFVFRWQGGRKDLSESYAGFVRTQSLTIAMGSILLLPIPIVAGMYTMADQSLTGTYFGAAFLAVLALFLAAHFVYGMLKEFKSWYAGNAFFLVFCVVFFITLQENSAFSSATRSHASYLAYEFEQYHEGLLASLGISLNVMSGEDIFNAKCSACHEFGKKKVGPAYKDVLPKYEGHRDELISFISNPVKKDPAFPNMPNQGLKPTEVDSIAAYIMTMYKKSN